MPKHLIISSDEEEEEEPNQDATKTEKTDVKPSILPKDIVQSKEIKKEKIDPEFGDTGVGLNDFNGMQSENKNYLLNGASSEDTSVPAKKVLIDPRSEQIESTLTDIGELIVDPDVLFALCNLKALGKSLRDNESELQERPQPSKFGRNLFGDFHADSGQSATNILNPIGDGHSEIKQESQASKEFNSPPQTGRVFGGMIRLTPDAFAISSTKKRKSGTPSRGSVGGSPGGGSATNAEILQAQSESRGKLAVGA